VEHGQYKSYPFAGCTKLADGAEPIALLYLQTPYRDLYSQPTADQVARLQSKLLLALKDEKVNLALMSAEYKKAADLFQSLLNDTIGFLKALKRRSKLGKAFVRELNRPTGLPGRRAAKEWLRYKYGVKTTISDIAGCLDELNREDIDFGDDGYTYVRTSIKTTERGTKAWYGGKRTITETSKLSGVARYRLDSAALKSAASTGFTNLPALGWELMPYSFVVDWFTDVGSILSTLDSLIAVEPGSASWLYIHRLERDVWSTGSPSVVALKSPTEEGHYESYWRSSNKALSVRYMPTFSPYLDLGRVLSGISLLRGLGK
jgi:hypothetical protein